MQYSNSTSTSLKNDFKYNKYGDSGSERNFINTYRSGNYSTAFSYLILAGTGIYCYMKLIIEYRCLLAYHISRCSFLMIIVNSFIGFWRYGNPIYGYTSEPLFKITQAAQDLFLIPCTFAILILKYSLRKEFAYCMVGVPVIPFLTYIFYKTDSLKDESEKVLGALSSIGIGYLSYLEYNYFGIATSIACFIKIFYVQNSDERLKVPIKDLCNYATCFFAYFALKAIND